MKKIIWAFILSIIILHSFAQAPQAFKYQAVVRDISGNVIVNRKVSFKISLLKGSPGGASVYIEADTATTNNFGLANLSIGKGTMVSGNFSTIHWGESTYFIKIEFDPSGGTNYQLMGTSQMLSVPYALNSKTVEEKQTLAITGDTLKISSGNAVLLPKSPGGNSGISQYSQAEIDGLVPLGGTIVFNTDYKILQSFDGSDWLKIQTSGCVPKVNFSIAGTNQYGLKTTTTTLSANKPAPGVSGKWEILAGAGGIIAEPTKYNSTFTGTDRTIYKLMWSLMSKCDTSQSTMEISIWSAPPSVTFDNAALYVTPMDMGLIQWGSNLVTNAISITNGKANTDSIAAHLKTGVYAAHTCDTLNAYGHSDWYLPSKDELNAIYQNRVVIGGFTFPAYWSSTENSSDYAWNQLFDIGTRNYNHKSGLKQVRCVRK